MRKTVLPIIFSVFGIIAVLFGFFAISLYFDVKDGLQNLSFWRMLLYVDPNSVRVTLSTASGGLASVLGITITLVLLAVQLTANHYTPRVMDLFTKDKINIFLFSFFVGCVVYSFWILSLIRTTDPATFFIPYISVFICMVLTTICFCILIPYFFYLFYSLKPSSIIQKIEQEALDALRMAGRQTEKAKLIVKDRIEQIGDMAKSAVIKMDVEVAQFTIQAIQELVTRYLPLKQKMSAGWHEDIAFSEYSKATIKRIREQKTWLETRVSQQLLLTFNLTLNRAKDIGNSILISNRLIGQEAAKHDDAQVIELVIKTFNTMLKEAIYQKDKFTCYNVLAQYRLFAEKLLAYKQFSGLTERISFYFKYYGCMAESMGVTFILDTAAYDLQILNQVVLEQVAPLDQQKILKVFLDLPPQKGVLKMEAILGAYYYWKEKHELGRLIVGDLAVEDKNVLKEIKEELLAPQEQDFWELTDRGVNFNYVPEEQKPSLERVFKELDL
ncbi:MAG: DUF2254 family protein [Candidatus Margulisiibacteriota bacterium]|jgi:hypothetical protein